MSTRPTPRTSDGVDEDLTAAIRVSMEVGVIQGRRWGMETAYGHTAVLARADRRPATRRHPA